MEKSTSGKPTIEPLREPSAYPIQTRRNIPRKPVASRNLTRCGSFSVRTWWTTQPRLRIALYGATGVIVILIIGLSAGLSTRRPRVQNLPLPTTHGGPYAGDLTYYDPGLGACGFTSTGAQRIVAISHLVFDKVAVGTDPNANPLCGLKIRASREGKSVDLVVVDRCTGCLAVDIDVSRSVFSTLADIDQGRVGVEWAWLEDVPVNATG